MRRGTTIAGRSPEVPAGTHTFPFSPFLLCQMPSFQGGGAVSQPAKNDQPAAPENPQGGTDDDRMAAAGDFPGPSETTPPPAVRISEDPAAGLLRGVHGQPQTGSPVSRPARRPG